MTGTSNLIDLSNLPAPAVLEVKTYETILAEMKADLLLKLPDYDVENKSDPAIKVLEIAAYRETLIRQRVNDAAKAVMLAYAAGTDLDNIAANIRLTRFSGETDTEFRARIQLAPDGYSVAGPSAAYVFHAINAHADIADATAISPAPGEVLVSVLSKLGNGAASPEILTAVTDTLSDKTVRPLTDSVTVQSATIVDYEIVADIYTYSGPDTSVVIAEATAKANAYKASVRKIGRNPTLSGIYAALHVDGVQRVVLTSPTADVSISDTQCSNCTSITLTHAGTDE